MTKYTIGYIDPATESSAPMIKCEPINGREITMIFPDFLNDISLDADKFLELNRHLFSNEDYKEFKGAITRNKKRTNYKEEIIRMNDKISVLLI